MANENTLIERLPNREDAAAIVSTLGDIAEALTPPKSYSWAKSSDDDIVEAVQKAYEGKLDLVNDCGWTVGDERVVTLNQLPAGDYNYFHDEQQVTLVLMDYSHFYLADGVTKCKYVVGFKTPLLETEYMEADTTHNNSWADTRMQKCCDAIFDTMFPATLKPIFKKFQVKTGIYGDDVNVETYSNSYLALPAYGEVLSSSDLTSNQQGLPTVPEQNLTSKFEWYTTHSNIVNSIPAVSGAHVWLRSPSKRSNTWGCTLYANYSYSTANDKFDLYDSQPAYPYYIAPFGVI